MGEDSNTTVVFQGIDNNYIRGRRVAQTVSAVILSLLDAATSSTSIEYYKLQYCTLFIG